MNKILSWGDKLKKENLLSIIVVFFIAIVALIVILMFSQNESKQTSENMYDMVFYELVDYMENVETYLAKSIISTTSEQGAETLTNLWREANLAQTYLSMLPIESQELENTEKFLNQVSDYSYSLSRKNIYGENLTEDDLNNLQELHNYSIEVENMLNQLSEDLNSGRISWDDLNNDKYIVFAQEVSTFESSFTNLEDKFHEYSGLIYDGAFSEHIVNQEPQNLDGDNISENDAKNKISEFIGQEKIKDIYSLGLSENTNIITYTFSVTDNEDNNISIAISQKGGHIVYMSVDRNVDIETISQEDAISKGKDYLKQKGFEDVKETYCLKQEGVMTINYAGLQDGVVLYPDLIKIKVALDNGEILGIETTGYLFNHKKRSFKENIITMDEAKKTLNSKIDIESEGLAIIPTEWKTELYCYEFKGYVDGKEFLVYINAENGNEEDILVIKNTPNGTLTM